MMQPCHRPQLTYGEWLRGVLRLVLLNLPAIGHRLPPHLGPGISAAESAAENEEPADTLGSQGSKCLAVKVVQDQAVRQTVAASL